MPRKRCPGCDLVKYKHAYQTSEWNPTEKKGICSRCMARRKEAGICFESNVCFCWLLAESVPLHQRGNQSTHTHTRTCEKCLEKRTCKQCHTIRFEWEFTPNSCKHAAWQNDRGKCKGCMGTTEKHMWECKGCDKHKTCTIIQPMVAGTSSTSSKTQLSLRRLYSTS